ncbi:MAG: PP2C family protein-serine/threonine phosphatase [Gammaproteobacteria bacterium]
MTETTHAMLAEARVLVVDDSRLMRLGLVRALRELGIEQIAEAGNGREALESIRQASFDLMLLDIEMPEMTGLELLHAMKLEADLRRVPVIVISSSEQLDTAVRCIEAGAEDYLPKTFNPTLLRARVTTSIDKKRLRDLDARRVLELQHEKEQLERTQRRLDEELAEAMRYIRSSLPEPTQAPLRIDWVYQPSTELGGDAFGYHWIDDDHFAIYLLDVCGHGVGACLLAVTAINVIRSGSLPGVDFRDAAAAMSAISNAFQCEKHNDMYFTLWYGVYRRSTRTLTHCSGGHPPALLLSAADGQGRSTSERLRAPGLIVGVMPDIVYRAQSVQVPEGASLIVLCDGCFEIMDTQGVDATFEDFEQFMQAHGTAEDGLEGLLAWARERHGPGPLDDDFSIVRVRF